MIDAFDNGQTYKNVRSEIKGGYAQSVTKRTYRHNPLFKARLFFYKYHTKTRLNKNTVKF